MERGKVVALDRLEAHPMNYNEHPHEQIIELRKSLQMFGQVRDVIVWGQYIVAGHGVVMAARAEGWTEISATCLPDDWSEERVAAYLAADNETARLSAPDDAQLALLLHAVSDEELRELAAGGEKRLRELMTADDSPPDPGAQMDKAAELQEKWQVERGEVWQIGCHRLMCGDSTCAEDVGKLIGGERVAVLADPPYGIPILTDYGLGKRGKCAVDGKTFSPVAGNDKEFDPAFLTDSFNFCILWGANHYAHRLPKNGRWLVWDKREDKIPERTQADCELAWCSDYGAARIFRHYWDGMLKASERGESRQHPTQKPVALMEWCIGFAPPDIVIYDPFTGSGTIGVACERLGRQARMMEIEPKYCAVTLERLTTCTGTSPVLVAGLGSDAS